MIGGTVAELVCLV